jgi:PHD/YefM family antitoxin component YafN of YafNO toxin-antitoxin module
MNERTKTRVIPATEMRNNLSSVLDAVELEGITLIRRHKQTNVALINADLLEDLLELHDRDYVRSIAQARQDVKEGRTYTLDQAFGDLIKE